MAINFTDSPSNGATQTISGRTYTYNSSKNKWDTTATEVTGPTAAVYASVDNLPTSGNITGSQAFVSGTNRLYIWNGSGWYNIALINNNPSISGVASSYDLAIDGTATTVTIVATDPEGLPITYSIASDTSGSTATVAQGTGSNTNVFTITPSTNSAHAGSFSLTFRASDGINLATAVSSFTLQFTVQNSKYTTALITSVGANNAVNNSFDDKSTSNHTITANGDAHQTTFSPYRHGGYSTYFDGSGDYLNIASDTSLQFGTGAFTVEYWMWNEDTNHINNSSYYPTQVHIGTYLQNNIAVRFVNDGDKFKATINSTTTDYTVSVPEQEWAHVAFTRDSSGDCRFFLNGTQIGSTFSNTETINPTAETRIGRENWTNNEYFKGYLTDVRIVKGTAVYTSNFTPPTGRLTAVTNTTLLACHLPYIADGSTTGHAITVNGNTKTLPFAPYDAQEYSAADHGGSIVFDGSGDYLATAADSSLTVGTGQFTLECWFKVNADTQYTLLALMNGSTNVMNIFYYHTNDSIGIVDSGWVTGNTGSGTNHDIIDLNIWHHLALVRDATNMKLYVNGVERHSAANSTNYNNDRIWIGANQYGNNLSGNISDVRLVKGTAVYTSNFTPPTAPLTAITNTKLLVQSTDAGIIDKSQTSSVLVLDGDTKCSSTQTKYRSTAIYTDGTGDRVRFGINNKKLVCDWGVGGEPFTVEWWMYDTQPYTAQHSFGPQTGGGAGAWNSSTGHQWITYWNSNVLNIYYYGTNGSYSGNTCTAAQLGIVQNQWQHVAHTYDGTTWRLYVDGVHGFHWVLPNQPASVSGTYAALGSFAEAAYYTAAYYDDVRITKGLARYTGTSSFTPPTAALKG
tara:strand:- start:143 stop:2704 length:2562 start_codon:yes stop_codon:yes gene_type:complete